MVATELAQRQQGAIQVARGAKKEPDPFVLSPQMVRDLELMDFARRVLTWANRLRPGRPALPAGGRPQVYTDASVLVTLLVMAVWQLSPEAMVKRMQRWPALACACGYPPGAVISASQLRRRRAQLGLGVYFITFCALVGVMIGRGVLIGRDWVLDATIIDAFSRQDEQAGWSFSKRFGYKVHTLLCRDSLLPILFLLSPANRNDAPWAAPLMAIERFFALLKRYFQLNQLQAPGLRAAYRHVFEVYCAVLLVAWLADHLDRPDLMHARSRILAPC